jgi:hypothetical protein
MGPSDEVAEELAVHCSQMGVNGIELAGAVD